MTLKILNYGCCFLLHCLHAEVECAEPTVANSEWISGSRPPYKHQAAVTYACYTGYKMEGDGTMICGLNGQWTPEKLECTGK